MSLGTSSARFRTALVVGGTSGIGQGMALALAARDYQVTVCGRSAERGNAVVASLHQGGNGEVRHTFLPIDAFDLASVKKVAETVHETDVLVMTHSMATLQGYTPTEKNGLDQKLQLNYFSRVYLASILAPHMKPGSQIMTVLSGGVHSKYRSVKDDFELKNHYSVKNAADAAGFYTDAAWECLSRKYPELVFCHAAPGFVNTNWGTEMPWAVRTLLLRPLQKMFGKSLEECGETLTQGLLSIPTTGFYLLDPKGKLIDKTTGVKHTPEERDMIWEKTLELLPAFS